jgi:hypothetical protein
MRVAVSIRDRRAVCVRSSSEDHAGIRVTHQSVRRVTRALVIAEAGADFVAES